MLLLTACCHMTMRAHFAEEKLIVRCGQKLCLGNIAELVTRIVIILLLFCLFGVFRCLHHLCFHQPL